MGGLNELGYTLATREMAQQCLLVHEKALFPEPKNEKAQQINFVQRLSTRTAIYCDASLRIFFTTRRERHNLAAEVNRPLAPVGDALIGFFVEQGLLWCRS